jgi:hypothetical protein
MGWTARNSIPGRGKKFVSSETSRPETIEPPIYRVRGLKSPGRESDYPYPCIGKVNNEWNFTSSPTAKSSWRAQEELSIYLV